MENEFEVGEKVEWTHVSGNRNSVSFTAVTGYIHEIKGDLARCKRGKKGKKDHWVNLKKLGRPGDKRGTKPVRDIAKVIRSVMIDKEG